MAGKKNDAKRSSGVSVNVSLRLDPKMKYLIDLMTRDQKRTITGVIEWSLERAASQVMITGEAYTEGDTFAQAIDHLWSTDEATRVIKLAIYRQSLLDYDEMRIWETIRATKHFWKVRVADSISGGAVMDYMHMDLIQKHWDDLLEHVAKHKNSRSIVPYDLPERDIRQNGMDAEGNPDPTNDPDIPF